MATTDALKRASVDEEFFDVSDDEGASAKEKTLSQKKASVYYDAEERRSELDLDAEDKAAPVPRRRSFLTEVLNSGELKVVQRLKDSRDDVRFNSLMRVRGFTAEKLAACAPTIALLLSDPSMSNRWLAVMALDKLLSDEFVENLDAIAAVVKNSPVVIRQAAVDAMTRHAPDAPSTLQAIADNAAKFKQEAGQVRAWYLKREEEKQAREAQEYARKMAQREKNDGETRKKREAWEAEKRAQEEAKTAAAEQTEWKQAAEDEDRMEVRNTAQATIQAELDQKAQAAKEVRADLGEQENAALQKTIQEAKEHTLLPLGN